MNTLFLFVFKFIIVKFFIFYYFVSNFSLNFRTIYLFIVYYLILHVNGIKAMGREIGFILELHLS